MASRSIPGTLIFGGKLAHQGYRLNKMCYSFNHEENRKAFAADPVGYCERYGLTLEQKQAVLNKDVLAMLRLGGNIYYLAKLAGIWGLDVQDLGALQTGVTKEEFQAKLNSYAARIRR